MKFLFILFAGMIVIAVGAHFAGEKDLANTIMAIPVMMWIGLIAYFL